MFLNFLLNVHKSHEPLVYVLHTFFLATHFLNSASVLLNFQINRASNVARVLLLHIVIISSRHAIFCIFVYVSTAQKMKFSIKELFSIFNQIGSFLRIWSHLLKKSLMEKFICCVMLYV